MHIANETGMYTTLTLVLTHLWLELTLSALLLDSYQ